MMRQLKPAVLALVWMTILTGLAYPLLVTGIGQLLFPTRANGSLLVRDGTVVGSALIGQSFDDPRYFWSRPSATGPFACNGALSSGSNLGALNDALVDAVQARVAALQSADPGRPGPVPVDLVTASGSGLDPHISPAAAEFQVARVAHARGLAEEQVRALVRQHTEGRQWGFFGEARVNVLPLNLALDRAP